MYSEKFITGFTIKCLGNEEVVRLGYYIIKINTQ